MVMRIRLKGRRAWFALAAAVVAVAGVVWLERAARATVPDAARDTVKARLVETLLAAGRPADALAALGPDPAASGPRIRLAAARGGGGAGGEPRAPLLPHA